MADLSDCPTGAEIGPGVHTLSVVASEKRQNRSGQGAHLLIVLQRADGAEICDRLNLWHPKPAAVKWANARMTAIVQACLGVPTIPADADGKRRSERLHGIPMRVTVEAVERNDPKTGALRTYNEVTGYARDVTATGTPTAPAAPAGDLTPPNSPIPF